MYYDISPITLEGRLTNPAEIKNFDNKELAKFRIATSKGEKTMFTDIEWWNPNNAKNYLIKGKKVIIVGDLEFSEWTDKNDGKTRNKHFVRVRSLELRGSNKNEESPENDNSSADSEESARDFLNSVAEV